MNIKSKANVNVDRDFGYFFTDIPQDVRAQHYVGPQPDGFKLCCFVDKFIS